MSNIGEIVLEFIDFVPNITEIVPVTPSVGLNIGDSQFNIGEIESMTVQRMRGPFLNQGMLKNVLVIDNE